MQFLWLYFEDLIGKGRAWEILLELFISASAGLVNTALPLAVLLASVMTFGGLGENYELSAIKSAGISLKRTMAPLMIFASVIAFGSFLWADYVVPYTNLKVAALMYDVGKLRPELNILPGVFLNVSDKMSIRIGSKNMETAMMYDLLIYDHSRNGKSFKVTRADSGYMQLTDNQRYMLVTLYGGSTWVEMDEEGSLVENFPERRETFQKQTVINEIEGYDFERTGEVLFKQSYQVMKVTELKTAIDLLTDRLNERKGLLASSITGGSISRQNVKDHVFSADSSGFYFSGSRFAETISNSTEPQYFNHRLSQVENQALLTHSVKRAETVRKHIENAGIEIRDKQLKIF